MVKPVCFLKRREGMTREEFQAFCAEPIYLDLVVPDEARFLDRDSLVWMITEEPMVTIDGPTSSAAVR
jgi:hypothetical protein